MKNSLMEDLVDIVHSSPVPPNGGFSLDYLADRLMSRRGTKSESTRRRYKTLGWNIRSQELGGFTDKFGRAVRWTNVSPSGSPAHFVVRVDEDVL